MNHHREQHFQIQDDRSVGLFKNHEVLRQDKHGADVVKLQTDLRDLGYTDVHGDPLEPDGRFGRNTHHAVENFQRDHDLNADGVVGPNTWAALRNVVRISSVAPTVTQISGQNQQSSQDPVDTSPVYPSDTANQQLVLLQAQVLEMQRQMEAMIRQRELGHEKERGDSFAVSSETPRHAAFDEYTPAQRITWRLGYSDPRHPQHDLYIDVKERLKADGHHLPEDRLTQVVGEMHTRGFQPNWEGYAKVHNDAVYVSDFSPWANRVRVDLKEPAPSVQETLRQVDDHQQTLTQQHALREQQTQSRGHGHSLSP
ncbi:peptidoglycan-binding protein [Dyella acidisoli]